MSMDVGAEPPWLLLDVDGPLNPFAGMPDDCPPGFHAYRLMPPSWERAERERLSAWGRPHLEPTALPVWLNPTHGALLAALPFRLAWASTWGDEANGFISPLLGLPSLPFVEWSAPRHDQRGGLLWKTPEVVEWAAGRPFAWLDDEFSDADRDWVAEHHEGPALLYYVNPRLGLQADDFKALSQWAVCLPGRRPQALAQQEDQERGQVSDGPMEVRRRHADDHDDHDDRRDPDGEVDA